MPSRWKSFALTPGNDLSSFVNPFITKIVRMIQVSVPAILLRFDRIWTQHAHLLHLFIFFPPPESWSILKFLAIFRQSHACPNSWNPLIRLDSLLDELNEKGNQWHLDSSSWLNPWKSLKWATKWDAEKRIPNVRNTSLRTPTLLCAEFNYSHQRSQLRKTLKNHPTFCGKRRYRTKIHETLSMPRRGASPGWSKVPYIVWVLITNVGLIMVDSLSPII